MTAPVCPSLPVYRPGVTVGTEVRSLGAPQSPQTTSTTGTLVGGSLLRISQETTAPVSAPVSVENRWPGDLLAEVFSATVVHVERRGRTVHGNRPSWLSRPMVLGSDIAREAWSSKVHRP